MTTARQQRKQRRQKQRMEEGEPTGPEPVIATAEVEPTPDAAAAAEPAAGEKMDMSGPMPVQVVEMPYRAYGGATSWEQLEAFLEARDEADAIRSTTYRFEELVDNIMADESIENKGQAVAAVAQEFDRRLQMERDEEKAAAEPERGGLTASLQRIFQAGIDAGKAALTSGSINDLPDAAFAYIEPGGKKDAGGKTTPRSLRHYPVHDIAHARNALARASQMMARGGKSAAIAKAAMPKIKAAAAKFKIGVAKKDSGFLVEKDRQGNFRWIGWTTGHWRDQDYGRHEKGELIPTAAHQRFMAWLDAKAAERAPELWAWHTPGTATKHRADWWDYADGFVLMSGPLTKAEGERLAALAAKEDLAMSHGFLGWNIDAAEGIIGDYRSYEVSYLPRQKAAAVWTAFETIRKEVTEMLNPDKRAFLVSAIGEDRVRDIEADTKGAADTLDLVLESKEAGDPEPAPAAEAEPTPAPAGDPAPEPEGEPVPEAIKALAKSIAGEVEAKIGVTKLNGFLTDMAGQVGTLQKTVAEIGTKVEALQKTDDQKIAEAITPAAAEVKGASVPIWLRAASASQENLIDPASESDKRLAEAKPSNKTTAPKEVAWAAGVFGASSPA